MTISKVFVQPLDKDLRDEEINSEKPLTCQDILFLTPYKSQEKLFNAAEKILGLRGDLIQALKSKEKIDVNISKDNVSDIIWLLKKFGKHKNLPRLLFTEDTIIKNSDIAIFLEELDSIIPQDLIPIKNEKGEDLIFNSAMVSDIQTSSEISEIDQSEFDEDEFDEDKFELKKNIGSTIRKSQGRQKRAVYISWVRNQLIEGDVSLYNIYQYAGFLFGTEGQSFQIVAAGRAQEVIRIFTNEDFWKKISSIKGSSYDIQSGRLSAEMMLTAIKYCLELKNNSIPYNEFKDNNHEDKTGTYA